MPRRLARKATSPGASRARSSSRPGAVMRRSSSAVRSLAAVPLMTLRNASTFQRALRQGETAGDKLGKAAGDPAMIHAPVGLAPVDDRIAHAEHRQHGQSRVGPGPDAAVVDAGLNDLLEDALDAPALAADAPAARVRQIAAL